MMLETVAGCFMMVAMMAVLAVLACFLTDFVFRLFKIKKAPQNESRLENELDKAMKKIELLELDQEEEDPAPTELEELVLAHATLYPEWWERRSVSDYTIEYLYPSLNIAIRKSEFIVGVVVNYYLHVDGMRACAGSHETIKKAVQKVDAFISKDHDARRDDAVADVVAKLREGA